MVASLHVNGDSADARTASSARNPKQNSDGRCQSAQCASTGVNGSLLRDNSPATDQSVCGVWWRSSSRPGCSLWRPSATQPGLELGLAHLRIPSQTTLACLVAELGQGASTCAPVGPQATAPPGRDVPNRGRADPARLPGTRPLLVDGARCDLGRRPGVPAAPLQALLDVFVLPFPLVAPALLRHRHPPHERPPRPPASTRGRPSTVAVYTIDSIIFCQRMDIMNEPREDPRGVTPACAANAPGSHARQPSGARQRSGPSARCMPAMRSGWE